MLARLLYLGPLWGKLCTSGLAGSWCRVVSKPSWSTVGIKTAFTEFLVLHVLEPPIQPNTHNYSWFISRMSNRMNILWCTLLSQWTLFFSSLVCFDYGIATGILQRSKDKRSAENDSKGKKTRLFLNYRTIIITD